MDIYAVCHGFADKDGNARVSDVMYFDNVIKAQNALLDAAMEFKQTEVQWTRCNELWHFKAVLPTCTKMWMIDKRKVF